jgi:hypothetical protein
VAIAIKVEGYKRSRNVCKLFQYQFKRQSDQKMKVFIVLLLASMALAGTINENPNYSVVRVELQEPPQSYEKPMAHLRREKRSTMGNASQDQFPFIAELVSMFQYGPDFCTGALITKDRIITALQCVKRQMTNDVISSMEVFLGDVVYNPASELRQKAYAIYGAWIHSEDEWPHIPDIAVMRLSVSFDTFPHIKPVSLTTANVTDLRGTEFTVISWIYVNVGLTRMPDRVKYTNLKIDQTPADCGLKDFLLCASVNLTEYDAGSSARGSPLVAFDEKFVGTLIGVQTGMGGLNQTSIFGIDVAHFLSFIVEAL